MLSKIGESSPRSRKIIYLMHKRKEIALRRTKVKSAHNTFSDSYATTRFGEMKHSNADIDQVKPDSFFKKVSEEMSRAFTFDR